EGALAEEHPGERLALELLAGKQDAGHPPGVLHTGEVGTDLLGQLDGDAVMAVRGDLDTERGAEMLGGEVVVGLVPPGGEQDTPGGADRVLRVAGPDDHAAHGAGPVCDEPYGRCL